MPKKIKYFYDTEFIEDGKTIDLISIGIVAEDGREYYAVSDSFDMYALLESEWLMKNVAPSLPLVPIMDQPSRLPYPLWLDRSHPDVKPRKQIRDEIVDFVGGTWPEFWAWYGAYDHVALCQLFGRMIDLPAKFPMFTRDIVDMMKRKGLRSSDMPQQPDGNHNALADARFNVVRYNFLEPLPSEE